MENLIIDIEFSSFGNFDIVVFLVPINLVLKQPCNDWVKYNLFLKDISNIKDVFNEEIEEIIFKYFNSEMNEVKNDYIFFE
jgi:hypothetical protein